MIRTVEKNLADTLLVEGGYFTLRLPKMRSGRCQIQLSISEIYLELGFIQISGIVSVQALQLARYDV
jgi:hypothetical protein